MSERPPTSTDVARLAGVSQATVSYVLNDVPGARVSEDTRARVRAAAESLGYAPHASARALRTGRSGLVLMPMPPIPMGPLASAFFAELSDRLREHGLTTVMYGDAGTRGVEAARAWAQWRPDAVLVEADRLTPAAVRQLHAAGTATVVALGAEPSPLVPSIVFDHAAIGACAARHLISQGHTEVCVLVPTEPGLAAFGELRLAGARNVTADVTRVDLPFDESAAAELVAAGRLSGAVFAYNDEYAMLLMRALQDAGLDVPGDVAVVGADDLPLARLLRPRLTSVRVLGGLTAEFVADRVHAMVRDEVRDPAVTFELTRAEIVIRASG